ncbi:MAG: mandelate racemase/muconate lactonizing enzyme family protein [Nitrososphaerales archaeon]
MKITGVDPIVLYAQDTSRGMNDKLNVGGYTGYQVIVHITTDSGIDGWGEACTGSEFGEAAFAVKTLIERGLTRRLKGEDPVQYRKIWDKLYSAIEWYGRRGLGIFALSGIDSALIDIASKALDVPAYQLIGGGKYRTEIPLYASLLFDMEDHEGTAKKAESYIRDGYLGAKFGWGMLPEKSFGRDPDADENIVSVIRKSLGPKAWIMVDVGRYVNWSPTYAIQMARRFSKYNIFWLEEALPQDDIDGYVELTSSVDTTIATGEGFQTIFDFKELISRKAVDLIQPDVSKSGGLSETKRIVEFARIHNLLWVPHNWSTAINTAASLQLVAACPDAFLMEFKQEPNPLIHDLSKKKFEIKNGRMQVPDTPGLGIEIDESVVEKYTAS